MKKRILLTGLCVIMATVGVSQIAMAANHTSNDVPVATTAGLFRKKQKVQMKILHIVFLKRTQEINY